MGLFVLSVNLYDEMLEKSTVLWRSTLYWGMWAFLSRGSFEL